EDIRQSVREADQAMARERLGSLAASDTERFIIEHMNGLPPHLFPKLVRRVPEARAHVQTMKIRVRLRSSTLTSEERGRRIVAMKRQLRRKYLRMLREIELQPQPFYSPSKRERTDRIFPVRPGILAL